MDQPTAAADKQGTVKLRPLAQPYTFMKDGYPLIRNAVITFAIVLAMSIALVAVCRFILLRAEPGKAEAQAVQIAARDKVSEAERERIEIRDFQPKFEQLRTLGFYGNENRLAMLEAIKSIQESRRLLPMRYEFSPQQLVPLDPTLLATTLELRATRIALQLELLHELDLLHFLRDLKSKGFYTAKECSVTAMDIAGPASLAPRQNAECVLYWVTIGEPAIADPNGIAGAPQ